MFTHESFDRTTRSPQEMQEEGARFNVMKQIRILLDDPEFQSFIWWLPDGKSFCVSSTSELASKILFQYFGETQFKSFVTTMKKEGFERVKTSGESLSLRWSDDDSLSIPFDLILCSFYCSTDHFGEAVYSHELFRMGRPDLCGRMYRGGTADHLGLNQVPGTVVANSLTDQYLMPNSLGNNPYAMAPTAASNVSSMQSLHGAMNPTMMAQRTNGMNYPMPMNGVMSAQFPGAAAGMGMAHMLNQPSNPFAFNRMSSTDMQKLAQANHHRESLLQKQNQLIQSGMGAEQAAAANQQQIMASIMSRRNSGQAGMTPTEQLQQQHNIMKSEGNEATFNRRNTAPAAALPQGASASSNSANDITKMSILEIEDELLRVKELKLMMMKRKLEAQLEANEKE